MKEKQDAIKYLCINQSKLAVRSIKIIQVVRLFITIVTIFDIKVFTVCVLTIYISHRAYSKERQK